MSTPSRTVPGGSEPFAAGFLRRVRIVLRFLFPTPAEREYARLLRGRPEFDRAFYLASNPRLRGLFRLAPERHYVQFGEPIGLCPNPGFSPRAYLFHNPDVAAAGHPPLLHYLRQGRGEGRTVMLRTGGGPLPDLPAIAPTDRPDPPAPVAVVLHLYYHDMWPEFAALLRAQRFAYDLYVTLTGSPEETAPTAAAIRTVFPRARVWAMPNRGRDILPFLHLAQSGVLAPYAAVCKLHGKKSPHRGDGDAWRQRLARGVLGDPDRTQARLEAFLADTASALWVADGQLVEGDAWWGINRLRAEALLNRAGVSTEGRVLRFAAGSIYWIKPALIARLAALNLKADDFEPEQALVDGTTAHAIERALGVLADAAGLGQLESRDLDRKPMAPGTGRIETDDPRHVTGKNGQDDAG